MSPRAIPVSRSKCAKVCAGASNPSVIAWLTVTYSDEQRPMGPYRYSNGRDRSAHIQLVRCRRRRPICRALIFTAA
jgi:hypothetical protein